LSVTLQCINADDCYVVVNVTIHALKSLCTDEKVKSFYDLAKKNADGKHDPSIFPHQRNIPQRIMTVNHNIHLSQWKICTKRSSYFDIIFDSSYHW